MVWSIDIVYKTLANESFSYEYILVQQILIIESGLIFTIYCDIYLPSDSIGYPKNEALYPKSIENGFSRDDIYILPLV